MSAARIHNDHYNIHTWVYLVFLSCLISNLTSHQESTELNMPLRQPAMSIGNMKRQRTAHTMPTRADRVHLSEYDPRESG